MPREINRDAMYPRKSSSSQLPEALKMEVTQKANELIETVLKPRSIQPPPENPQFNYIVDIYGKWYQKAFYFCAEYRGQAQIQPNPASRRNLLVCNMLGINVFISRICAIPASGYKYIQT